MELLDIYNEQMELIGTESRDIVHSDALWHKTVHCWLYDKKGYIFFQIRKDSQTLYTTASGHVKSKETVKEAFGREINEETGLNVDFENAELIEINHFKLDTIKKGKPFHDRAFAHVYILEYNDELNKFDFDDEVDGLVLVPAKETLKIFENESGSVKGTVIKKENITKKDINFEDFLVNEGETALGKYGHILKKVIEKTNN